MKKSRKYSTGIGIIAFLLIAYFALDHILFTGVRPRKINKNGFQANYYIKNGTEKKAALVLIGGGQWGDYWGQEFAQKGFVGLSLPYIGREGLPKFLEEINLAYFENAIKWLKKQPEVDPAKIAIMGASRSAELALVIASIFPDLVSGVVAYAPSSVSWSNTVSPYSSSEIKASWKYQGADIPYVQMQKLSGNNSTKIETLAYWKSGLAKTEELTLATIEVEKINGPILLFSGTDDKVWPSSLMADMIERRIKENNFPHSFGNIKYEDAGHLISSHPEINSVIRTGTININSKNYEYENGGTMEGDQKAKQDAKIRLMEFMEKL